MASVAAAFLVVVAAFAAAPSSHAMGCLVAIDIGHSRAKPGAVSARGIPEWEFNSALARHVHAALANAGIPSLLLNPDGDDWSLKDRPQRAAEAGATLFVSLHHDSVQPRYLQPWRWQGRENRYTDRFSGFSLFISVTNSAHEESKLVAATIADRLIDAGLKPTLHHAEPIPGEGRELLDQARGIYAFDDLAVLKHARMPAVLIEAGVIVNRDDEVWIASDAYRSAIARAVAQASGERCGLAASPIR